MLEINLLTLSHSGTWRERSIHHQLIQRYRWSQTGQCNQCNFTNYREWWSHLFCRLEIIVFKYGKCTVPETDIYFFFLIEKVTEKSLSQQNKLHVFILFNLRLIPSDTETGWISRYKIIPLYLKLFPCLYYLYLLFHWERMRITEH